MIYKNFRHCRTECPASGKKQYHTYSSAVSVAVQRSRHVGPLRVYRCPECKKWHLTKRRVWDPEN